MPPLFHAELTLPNDPRSLTLARGLAHQLVEMADLPPELDGPLTEGIVEACVNVIEHAFEPGERGTFTLAGEITPTELIVSVRDQGLPFDPLRLPPSVQQSGGLAELRRAVDRLQWLHHGRSGKELRLVKHRPQQDVTQQLDEADLTPMGDDEPLAPEQEYQITRFRPEHAVGVCRCIYRVYGNTYLHDDAYYPDRLIRHNETGIWASVVALDASGEVVGHYALERPGLTRTAERGVAVVSPAHRGRDLMARMRVAIEDEARALGLAAVFSVAVTMHTYSQRVNEEFGSDVCGFYLGGGPSNTVFRKMERENTGQRVSWVLYSTYVQPPPPSVVHVPDHHRPIVERIYAGLPTTVEFRPGAPIPEGIEGDVEVAYNASMDNATILVRTIGEDTPAEVRQALEDLVEITGAEAIHLQIPLAQPSAAALCREAEDLGFFFLGIGPCFSDDGDALLLQYLAVDVDPSLPQVANPFAAELLAYVAAERERVRA
jgi:anti-sigma regulatory factor (Ser/Thr protein kinase)